MSEENQRPENCGDCKNFQRVSHEYFNPLKYGFGCVGMCLACDEITHYRHKPPRDCVFGRWWEQ